MKNIKKIINLQTIKEITNLKDLAASTISSKYVSFGTTCRCIQGRKYKNDVTGDDLKNKSSNNLLGSSSATVSKVTFNHLVISKVTEK